MIEEFNDNWNTGKLEYPFGRGINISMTISDTDNYYKELINKNITFFKDIIVNKYDVNGKVYLDK